MLRWGQAKEAALLHATVVWAEEAALHACKEAAPILLRPALLQLLCGGVGSDRGRAVACCGGRRRIRLRCDTCCGGRRRRILRC
jgi:hypothetical protein